MFIYFIIGFIISLIATTILWTDAEPEYKLPKAYPMIAWSVIFVGIMLAWPFVLLDGFFGLVTA